jgi:PAS domain S-box-containing protein
MLKVAAYRLVTLAVMACLLSEAHAIDPHRKFSQYVREKWSAANGLPGGAVHAIAQSPDGYLWIGTDKGLVRFDGFTFLPVPPKSLLPQNDPILGLTTDAEGDLWVRMQTAGVLRYNRGRFENLASGPNATVSQVTAIARENGAGMLLADLISGTIRLRNAKLDLVAPAAILPGAAVTMAIAETPGAKIWLGTLGAGLFSLENGRATRVTQGLTETKINCLLPVGEQELWVGTDHGLFRWNGMAFRRAELRPSLSDQPVLTILRDRDSNIWVGTTRGLLRINANGTSAEEEGMQRASAVNALFEDREGNLWVGGATGLERIRDSAFITYSTDQGPLSNAGGPVYVDGENRAWFAPEKGGLYWIKDGHIHAVMPALLGKDVIYSIAGRDHEIWIGRRQGGLTHLGYSDGRVTTETYGAANGLAQNSVYVTYQSRDGAVWAGTLSSGISRLKDGKFTTYTTTNGLASNTVLSALEGHDGTMWFGTPNGLSALSNGKWRTYSLQDGLPSDNVNCLFEDSAGALWIGTSAGLAYFQMGRMHTLREAPETLREQIVGMAEDKGGRFWIATSGHVLRVPRDKVQSGAVKAVDVREYDQVDGLESTEGVKRSRSVVSDSAGSIWFSLSRGLSVVSPSQITDNSVPALPHIEAITADNNSANLDASVRIPPSPRRITFEYAGLSLAVPGRIRFRYFLENFDNGWSQPVPAREAVYTHLGPGSYRFRLVASNSEGLWNGPETVIDLHVAPAYYQTYWFRLLCVAIFIALLWALHRWRVHQLKVQEERLREAVETIPALTFTTSSDGSNTFVNKRWIEYTGLSVDETSGIGWQRAIHPEDLMRHSEQWRICVATGQVFEDEARFRSAIDGQYRWFLVRGVPLRDKSGKIVRWYGTLTDIEDRKRAEETLQLVSSDLQASKAKLEEAQRITHVGYWEWDLATNRIKWSDETYRIYGMRPQERLVDLATAQEKIHSEDWRRGMEAALGGDRFNAECRLFRPTGEVRIAHFQGEVKRDASGQPYYMFGTVQDITDRKRAEEALQQSQFYLAEGQRLAHMGSWAFNPSGFFEYWSQELFKIYGLDPQKGAPTLEQYLATLHPQDRGSMADTVKRMLAEHSGCDVKKRIVHPDGEQRYIRCVGIPVIEGEVLKGFLGTAIDITEQELLTRELERRQAYLAEAQRLTHTGSWAINVRTDEHFWSEEMFRINEIDPKWKPAWSLILDRVHPDDRASLEQRKNMEFTQTGWADSEADLRIVLPDGRIKHLHTIAHPVMDASGHVIEVIGTTMDVTERKRIEDSLRRSESHLAEAQKLTHTASWAWRVPNRNAVEVSEEFYRIYGFDPVEGAPTWEEYLERVHPEDRLKWKDTTERAIGEKADYDHEFRILLPNGKVRWIHTVGHPVLSNAGDLEQFVGSSTDITERKHAEQEREKVRQLEADLAHINRVSTLGEMAASLAHEIKQPIAAAITSANSCIEWLAHEPPNLDRARAAAARIDKYGNRAAEMIDRIRSFYKKSPPQRELVDVNGIIQEMLTLLKGEATRHSVALHTELAAELPKIMADRVQLQQVFMNLMVNGIEAMKDSGGELTVKSQLRDSQLQFSVNDTGPGLPAGSVDQIFSAFFTTKPQGSGMGLAISRSIVESHGGRLWAAANGRQGATFNFTLPAQTTESSPLVA